MPDDGPDNEGSGGSESGQESGGPDGPITVKLAQLAIKD